MTLETEVAALTAATTVLINTVNVRKADLDASVAQAEGHEYDAGVHATQAGVQAAAAAAQAAAANNSALSALGIFGNTAALNAAMAIMLGYANTAQGAVSQAQAAALAAQSVVSQDLSGISVAGTPLHRSPNAIVQALVYDTSKDSDGGAWIDRMGDKSWMNEALNGNWLTPTSPDGWQSELDARGKGASLGAEVNPDPVFASAAGWTLDGTAGIAGNKLTFTSTPNNANIATRSDPVGGAMTATPYQVVVVVDSLTSGVIRVRLGTALTYRSIIAPGTYRFTVTPAAGSIIRLMATESTTGVVSQFSVKPVTAFTTQSGDFFQLATDGKFYKLNAGTGITEVFRGNTAKFPRLAALVLEASSLTIYDLTAPGRPMWMRFVTNGATSVDSNMLGIFASATTGIAAKDGKFSIATAAGLQVIDFLRDGRVRYTTTALQSYVGNIAQRNDGLGQFISAVVALASQVINAVAVMTRPNAPVDPSTGLPIPTIGVAYGTGNAGQVGAVIMDDGSVVQYAYPTRDGGSVSFTKRGEVVWSYSNAINVHVMPLATANVANISSVARGYTTTTAPNVGLGARKQFVAGDLIASTAITSQASRVDLIRENPTTPTAGLGATITGTYNTGWMPGDIKRCLIAETVAGAVVGGELVADPGFDTGTGWTLGQFGIGPIATISGSQLQVTNTDGPNCGYGTMSMATIPNRTYKLVLENGAGSVAIARIGVSPHDSTIGSFTTSSGSTSVSFFVATTSTTHISVRSNIVATTVYVNSVSVTEIIADRSYKNKPATVYGTLALTPVAAGAQLCMLSGFSASNYVQETYSSDLDFGTGAWSVSTIVNVPSSMAAYVSSFPELTANLVTNGDFSAGTTGWTIGGGATFTESAGVATITNTGAAEAIVTQPILTVGRVYKVAIARSGAATGTAGYVRLGTGAHLTLADGANTLFGEAVTGSVNLSVKTNSAAAGASFSFDNVDVKEIGPCVLFDRAHSSGARIQLAMDALGRFIATAYDGTTTRTVTTTQTYLGYLGKVSVSYTTDGTLSIRVDGEVVATATGAALLTLNNASATMTIGNSHTLDAPFPGSIGMVKASATAPSNNAARWMWAQEKEMLRAGAQVTLADTGNVIDMAYDPQLDRWTAVTATSESSFNGLVRTSAPAYAGSISKIARGSGVKLVARTTTLPGVDITMPSLQTREELLRRGEEAAARARLTRRVDFDAIVSQTDFALPVGWETQGVTSDGVEKREGSTKDWTRKYDGFVETISFGVSPGDSAWVQAEARRAA